MFKSKRVRELEDELWKIKYRISNLKVWCSEDEKVVAIAEWLKNPDCDIGMFREKLRKMENK
ncbi:coil containing protein [Vibrio phage 1.101.O._10N.261.45.C6]|nr:coil containing protein [Vibrio phage 1.101.O._10N.261.45.C6]